jgi:hypothetical protein
MISGDASSSTAAATTGSGCCCSSVDPIEISVCHTRDRTGRACLAEVRVCKICSVRYLLLIVVFATNKGDDDAAFGGKSQINLRNKSAKCVEAQDYGREREWFVKCIFVEGCCLHCWIIIRRWSLSCLVRRSNNRNFV